MNSISIDETKLQKDTLMAGTKISVAVHGMILAFFILKATFMPDVDLQPTESAIRVDLVALPDKVKPNELPKPMEPDLPPEKEVSKPKEDPRLPPPVAETKIKNIEKKEEAINLDRIKQKQGEALKKLKAQSALDKIKEDLEREELKEHAKQRAASKLKGNLVASGNSLSGINKLQHDSYVSDLERSIKQNFYLAEWLRKKQLKTVVRIRFNAIGKIISHAVVISSGNPSYDDSAVEAVEKTAPFPPPPEKLVDYFEGRGFDVEFTDSK